MNAITTLTGLSAWLLSLAGMTALAFALERHHEPWTGPAASVPEPLRRPLLRSAGIALLMLAAHVCARQWGGPVGVVLALGWLSAGALSTALLLTYVPRRTPALAFAASPVALALHVLPLS